MAADSQYLRKRIKCSRANRLITIPATPIIGIKCVCSTVLVYPIMPQFVNIPTTLMICKTSSHTPRPADFNAIGRCLVKQTLYALTLRRTTLFNKAINGSNGNTEAKNRTKQNCTIIDE